jgi:hypothetical protein
MKRKKTERKKKGKYDVGSGALCPEAQADGVPCTELGRDCETCEKAMAQIEGAEGKEPW